MEIRDQKKPPKYNKDSKIKSWGKSNTRLIPKVKKPTIIALTGVFITVSDNNRKGN